MDVFFHYTSHKCAKSIRRDGRINPSSGFYDRSGVWLTKKNPDYSKEDILWNNFEYDEGQCQRNISRAACYVKIDLPRDKVEDLSYRRKWGNDLWLWPDVNGPLYLDSFKHNIGSMDGTVDAFVIDRVLRAANRAFDASSITRALSKIEWDRAMTEDCKEEKIRFVKKMFWKIVNSKYHIIELDAIDLDKTEDLFTWTQRIGLFLCDYVVSNDGVADDSDTLFDKFVDSYVLTYIVFGIL